MEHFYTEYEAGGISLKLMISEAPQKEYLECLFKIFDSIKETVNEPQTERSE